MIVLLLAMCAPLAQAQYLYWKLDKGHPPVSAIYGEVKVLASSNGIFYCGCDWWPSAAAGGYFGVQETSKDRRAVFSVWDTTQDSKAETVFADARTVSTRFTNEGRGAHNHVLYNWREGQAIPFYLVKDADRSGQNILVSAFIFDEAAGSWKKLAVIKSPVDGRKSVSTFGGVLNSFLENFRGKDKDAPKVALYRLWAGSGPSDLSLISKASGKGEWGISRGWFFLAEGDREAVNRILQQSAGSADAITWGDRGVPLTITNLSLEPKTLSSIRKLH